MSRALKSGLSQILLLMQSTKSVGSMNVLRMSEDVEVNNLKISLGQSSSLYMVIIKGPRVHEAVLGNANMLQYHTDKKGCYAHIKTIKMEGHSHTELE